MKQYEIIAEINNNMILIPGGTFEMKWEYRESTEHYSDICPHMDIKTLKRQTTVSSFYLSKYLVTNKYFSIFLNEVGNENEQGYRWAGIVKNNSYCGLKYQSKLKRYNVNPGWEDLPVTYVTWYGAVGFCNWVSEKNNLNKCYGKIHKRGTVDMTANGFRLPTEAELYYTYQENYNLVDFTGSLEMGIEKKSNRLRNFGLTEEWCTDVSDVFLDSPEPVINPVGTSEGIKKGNTRYYKSGYWRTVKNLLEPPEGIMRVVFSTRKYENDALFWCRCFEANLRLNIGFRLARSIKIET